MILSKNDTNGRFIERIRTHDCKIKVKAFCTIHITCFSVHCVNNGFRPFACVQLVECGHLKFSHHLLILSMSLKS